MNNKNIVLPFLLMFLILLFFYIEKWDNGGIYEKIEVEVYSNSLIIPITIEGRTYSFQLDTGAPTSISQELYFGLCLNSLDSLPSTDYYGNRRWVHRTNLPEIKIGNSTFSDIDAGIINPIQGLFLCNKKIDGYLGSDFFHDKMLMMNLMEKEVIITNDRSKLPIRRQDAISLEFFGEQLSPMLVIEFPEKNTKESVFFDTGSNNDFYRPTIESFNEMFINGLITSDNILDTLYVNNSRGLFGSQNDSINFRVRYDTIRIGKINFTNYTASTFGAGSGSKIGAQLLKKGTVIIDWKYSHLYFNPYPNYSMDFKTNAGFNVHYEWDKFCTSSTQPGSVAYSHGVRDGFVLTQLNDIQLDSFTTCDLLKFDWAYEWSKPEVTVKLEFEGQEYCINESKNIGAPT